MLAGDPVTATMQSGQVLFAHAETMLWLMLRIGGALMAAPMIGTRALPMRARLLLTISLSVALTPLLPVAPGFTSPDAFLVLAVTREIAIGVAMGLMLRMAFEAGALAGEAIAQGMGLSFAMMADPLRGNQSGVVGQFFYVAFGLLFFAFNGHLALIELIFNSYAAVPVATPLPNVENFLSGYPAFLPMVLQVGFRIALPMMLALLVSNLAFGLLGRAAPSFNPIAVGLPASLLLGLALLPVLIGEILVPVQELFDAAFLQAAGLLVP